MNRMKRFSAILALGCLLLGSASAMAQRDNHPMVSKGLRYLNTPYVAHTLEIDPANEDLVVNCDEVDCTTFVEYVLAEAICSKMANGEISEGQFADNLIKIRYRNGEIKGYTSRLHYIAEWVNNGVKQGVIEDVAATNSRFTMKTNLSFMSSHPELYPQLANSPANVATMKQIEEALNGFEFHYVPQEQLPNGGLSWIKNGDIIAITTNIPGLDVAHMGIAMYVDNKLTLLHASSVEKKVVISTLSLAQMLKNNAKWTGIRVLRMKQ